MKITYDEPKRATTLTERRLDMAALTVAFFETATVFEAKDDRFMAVGPFEGDIISVVFKPLGTEAISIISMRRASRKERNAI